MIDSKMRYEAGVFLDADDMGPTPDNTTTLIEVFRDVELVPRVFHQIRVPNAPRPRLRLSSLTNEWQIDFAMNRINIIKNPGDLKGDNLGDISDFASTASEFFHRIFERYAKRANRLMLAGHFLLKEMSPDDLFKVYTRLLQAPGFYTERIPFEWDWRSAVQDTLELDESSSEVLNVVTTVKRLKGEIETSEQIVPFDRISILLDINTSPDCTDYRFGTAEIQSYFDLIPPVFETRLTEMLEFINE